MASCSRLYGFTSAGKDLYQSAQLDTLDESAGSVHVKAGLVIRASSWMTPLLLLCCRAKIVAGWAPGGPAG